MKLKIKPKANCQFDLLSLGEVMLRLDPGEGRIRTARSFRAWEGGGEYNVARGLRKCFGLRAAVATALVDNEIGRLIEDLMMQGGLGLTFLRWRQGDGIGRNVRNGLNFTERGFGLRGAVGVSDRGLTAASQLKPGDFDWDHIFGELGVRWFHTGGIFAGLSDGTSALAIEAAQSARRHGTVVSYDLNYRPSLWANQGGPEKAWEVNRKLAEYVDVMIGNEEDFTQGLGFTVPGVDENLSQLDVDAYQAMINKVAQAWPGFQVIATTLRTVRTASVNDWSAILWTAGQFFQSRTFSGLEIMDRVGGGDSFASGLIYGLLELGDPSQAVEYGAAHGALAMTTPGDTSMATLKEVQKLVAGGSARVIR